MSTTGHILTKRKASKRTMRDKGGWSEGERNYYYYKLGNFVSLMVSRSVGDERRVVRHLPSNKRGGIFLPVSPPLLSNANNNSQYTHTHTHRRRERRGRESNGATATERIRRRLYNCDNEVLFFFFSPPPGVVLGFFFVLFLY